MNDSFMNSSKDSCISWIYWCYVPWTDPEIFLSWQLLIQRADVNESNDLTLAEFVNYVQEHEKRLLLVFHTLDANSDGKVTFNFGP